MKVERPYWAIVLPDDTEFILGPQNGITLMTVTGVGMPPVDNILTSYALLDGASWQRAKVQPRVIQMVMGIAGAGQRSSYYAFRRALLDAVSPHRAVLPLELRYYGYDGLRTVHCHYDSGMELDAEEAGQERFVLRLLAADPFFYGEADSDTLDDAQDLALNHIIVYQNGEWSDLDGGVDPHYVSTITEGPDGRIYVGGTFTTAGGAAMEGIAAWDGSAWSQLGGVAGMDGPVYSQAWGPDGRLYIGGTFTDVAGGVGGTYNRIASYDPVTDTFAALGAGFSAIVRGIAVGHDGLVYAGGDFFVAAGDPGDFIAVWNGAAWGPVGAGMNLSVFGISVGPDGDVYAYGDFTTAGGNPATRIAVWDGANWQALSGTLDDRPLDVAWGADGQMYGAGLFALDGAAPMRHAARYQQLWIELAGGLDDDASCLAPLSDGTLLVGGYFGEANATGQPLLGLALWNGYSFVSPLVNLSVSPWGPWVSAVCEASDGALYVGGAFPSALASRQTIVHNGGSAEVHPVITIECPAQVGAPEPIVMGIHNDTTGHRMWFNYLLQEGETLTIDCRPSGAGLTSDWRGRMVGDNPLPGSQLSLFTLAPGYNAISVFVWDAVNGPGSTTVTITWDETWMGID